MMQFCVFSYNRGRFLEHCVQSIERCAPHCSLTVYDDDSDDPHTREVLERIGQRHRVVPFRGRRAGKHGGLYANMQAALDDQEAGALVCFIQDDMQLVRRLDEAETTACAEHFRSSATPALLQPAFLKARETRGNKGAVRFDEGDDCYYCERWESSAGAHYSDILIASVDVLRSIGWRFGPREAANETEARRHFPPLRYLRHPFMAWLPGVPAWRGRVQTFGLRLGQKLSHCGFHPLEILTEDERQAFLMRDPSRLPVAEDWLRCTGPTPPSPWAYHPLQDRRWLARLDSVERRLRSWFTPRPGAR